MINRIRIENFQILKDIDVELSPGINAITGSSRQGKSSFMRSLFLLLFNKPTGDHFINWNAKHCRVVGEFAPGGVVERYRDSTSNYYNLNDDTLKAMRGSVPDEVQSMTNITDDNVQHQLFRNIFMLDETSGAVSAKFNEVGGLSDIDETTSNLNGLHKKATIEKDQQKKLIDEYTTAVEDYANLDAMEKRVARIENAMEEIEGFDVSIEYLNEQAQKINVCMNNIQHLRHFLACEKKATELLAVAQEVQSVHEQISKLKQRQTTLQLRYSAIEQCEIIMGAESSAKKLKERAESVQDSTNQIAALRNRLQRLQTVSRERDDVKKRLDAKKSELREISAGMKICPFCKRPLTKEFADHVDIDIQ